MKGVVHHSNACDKQSADHGTIERLVSCSHTFAYKHSTIYPCMHLYIHFFILTDTVTHPLPFFLRTHYSPPLTLIPPPPLPFPPLTPHPPRFDPEMNQFVTVAKFNRVRRYIHHYIYSIYSKSTYTLFPLVYKCPLPSYHEPFSDILHGVWWMSCVSYFYIGGFLQQLRKT